MRRKTIDIGSDFSKVPAGRHPEDGDFSGELFRNQHLKPALDSFDVVEVVLDNTEGFGSSFLEEAFGGLVRLGFTKEFLLKHLVLVANLAETQRYKKKILSYIASAR